MSETTNISRQFNRGGHVMTKWMGEEYETCPKCGRTSLTKKNMTGSLENGTVSEKCYRCGYGRIVVYRNSEIVRVHKN
jgi:ribosomal protein S27AE